MRRLVLMGVLACATTALGAVRLGDSVLKESTVKEQIADVKKDLKKAGTDHEFAGIVFDVVRTKHALVAKLVGKLLLKEKSVDRQLIAAQALAEFKVPARKKAKKAEGDAPDAPDAPRPRKKDAKLTLEQQLEQARVAAGTALVAVEKRKKLDLDVIEESVRSIAALRYAPGIPLLGRWLERWRTDPWVPGTILEAFRQIDDKHALPPLLLVWEKVEEAGKPSPSAGVGAFGGRSRPNARTAPAPKKLKEEFAKTAHALTRDKGIHKPAQLRKWMKEHKAELERLGVKIPN